MKGGIKDRQPGMRMGIPVIHPGGHVSILSINTQENAQIISLHFLFSQIF
jgi:hypothetical protein